ncbi:MAG TPA: amidase family protein, partial [Candidatus Binataceae bacterium]|nr:amidase family protein [Candidatus Binataceae bacterium]
NADVWHGMGEEGALVRSVRDAAAALDIVGGYMSGDPYTAPATGRPYRDEIRTPPAQLKIGFMDRAPSFHPGVHNECAVGVRKCAKLLESLGHRVEQSHPAILDDDRIGHQAGGVLIASAEAMTAAYAEKILGRPLVEEDLDPWTWYLVKRGRKFSAVELLAARQWINEFTRATAAWWTGGFDILVTSTTAAPAPPVGILQLRAGEHPVEIGRRMADISPFTIPWNVAGNPAVSLPMHMTADGLPVGVQLVAAYGREDLLLRVAAQLEQAAPWANRIPSLAGV